MKPFLYDERPMAREFKNPALVGGLPPLRFPNMGEARTTLAAEVDRFLREWRSSSGAIRTHAVLGPLGFDEWSRSHFKHSYHHLLQFGLLDAD